MELWWTSIHWKSRCLHTLYSNGSQQWINLSMNLLHHHPKTSLKTNVSHKSNVLASARLKYSSFPALWSSWRSSWCLAAVGSYELLRTDEAFFSFYFWEILQWWTGEVTGSEKLPLTSIWASSLPAMSVKGHVSRKTHFKTGLLLSFGHSPTKTN